MAPTNRDSPLVVVFHAGDPEVLPLAEAALEQEGIEYLVRAGGGGVPVGFGHAPEFGGAEGTADILVNATDVDRATAVLADLASEPEAGEEVLTPSPSIAAVAATSDEPRAYRLTEVSSGTVVGELSEAQFNVLAGALEEESDSDRDYYIEAATIEMLVDEGADPALVELLKRALGSREGVELAWSRL
jgi:processive 1,2-diacylglycerol beta-glucosyltransferase